MRHRVWFAAAFLVMLISVPASARQMGLKAGGGVLLDPSRWGGHASFEIALSEEYPTNVAPFIEVYSKSGTHVIPLGLALLYKARFSDYGGTVFFGAGGGVLMIRGQPGFGVAEGTDGMITAAGGLSMGITERAGVFAQFRWFRSFEDQSAENQYGIQVGVQLQFGEE